MRAKCLPKARVIVRVDGKRAVEHGLENDGMTATAFIEAVPGANFAIQLDIEQGFAYRKSEDRIDFCVYIDGHGAAGNIVSTHHAPIHKSIAQARVEGKVETIKGVDMLREFQFAELKCTEDAAPVSVLKKFAHVGEIRVRLTRCRVSGPYGGVHSRFKETDDAVPEKAFKGRSISSRTKLGPGKEVARRDCVTPTFPYGKAPIATYVFQYRTRRDLEIEGIVERPHPLVPLEERDPDDLTPHELREELRLLRAAASKVKVKEEPKRDKRARSVTLGVDDNDGDDDVTITGVSDRRKRARASAETIVVLDLTED